MEYKKYYRYKRTLLFNIEYINYIKRGSLNMDDKIVRIPITYSERKKNQMGDGYVPCYISSRYLMIQGVSVYNEDVYKIQNHSQVKKDYDKFLFELKL